MNNLCSDPTYVLTPQCLAKGEMKVLLHVPEVSLGLES